MSCAVVDNLPKVPKEKLEKLMGVIERIFGQVGTIKEGTTIEALLRQRNVTCLQRNSNSDKAVISIFLTSG